MTIDAVLSGAERWTIEHGSMLDVLAALPENCIDSVCTDPPYELNFMARTWDRSGIAFRPETWAAALRVAKPGAHMLAFGGTRTMHRIACAIEDAGWAVRDSISWTFGSGFPKSLNCGDGRGTALKPAHEPVYLCRKPLDGTVAANLAKWGTGALNVDGCRVGTSKDVPWSAPSKQGMFAMTPHNMDGSGQDPNIGRWPPNFLLTHSADCRRIGSREVKANPTWDTPNRECQPAFTGEIVSEVRHGEGGVEAVPVFECVEGCPVLEMDAQSGEHQNGTRSGPNPRANRSGFAGPMPAMASSVAYGDYGAASRYFPQFEWDPELDDLDRFYYCAKAPRSERDLGLEHFRALSGGQATLREDDSAGTQNPRAGAGRTGGARNGHPTVKPIELMRWLTRLVTPAGGVCLDPFVGSGSTGVGAIQEGLRFVGIDLNDSDAEPFVSIARARITYVTGGLYVPRESLRAAEPPRQTSMFERTGS